MDVKRFQKACRWNIKATGAGICTISSKVTWLIASVNDMLTELHLRGCKNNADLLQRMSSLSGFLNFVNKKEGKFIESFSRPCLSLASSVFVRGKARED